jgi:N-acetylglucosamine kinase-like BadF-type ATPase
MFFVGVDCGGTKAAFVLTDEAGRVCGRFVCQGDGFFGLGPEGLYRLLEEGLRGLCEAAGVGRERIAYVGLGLPGYGEQEGGDDEILAACEASVGAGKVFCQCDCYIAWAGSLGLGPGVNIISGTGANCYGVNEAGASARSSGWGAYCDEGSCSWIAQKLIAQFAKQADGRAERTPLYTLFREHFHLKEDIFFIEPLNRHLATHNRETAKLQLLLKEIWDTGDPAAAEIYREAARELALAAGAVLRKLWPPGAAPEVSYSGGLFLSGQRILTPLGQYVAEAGGCLAAPKFPPDLGAVLAAMAVFTPEWVRPGVGFCGAR